ncbi:hypothetical protein DPEC_G00202040 [Dallia pectoralis]|uniref:Uncharacterized protein n=1 Tax=Dallia pectoralis TaxID=75939 RepID=A0ACC2G973_DALPE|nr:hypothetical protein DPEC_G00202040 [Dallia pectoralis]
MCRSPRSLQLVDVIWTNVPDSKWPPWHRRDFLESPVLSPDAREHTSAPDAPRRAPQWKTGIGRSPVERRSPGSTPISMLADGLAEHGHLARVQGL